VLVYLLFTFEGGLAGSAEVIRERAPEKLQTPNNAQLRVWISRILLLGLGVSLYPHAVQRLFAAKSLPTLRKSLALRAFMPRVTTVLAFLLGYEGIARFDSLSREDSDKITILVLAELGTANPLFKAMIVVVLAAVVAAIMSTTDSQLLVAASAVVRDLYEKVLHRDREVDQKRLVLLCRVVVAALVVLAVLLGFYAEQVVVWIVLSSWGGLGASLGPTSILALYWKGTTRAGVIAGMLAGAGTVIAWELTPVLSAALYELIPGFAVGLVVTVVVSGVTAKPEGVEGMFEEMRTGVRGSRVAGSA
jgi:Na+/proline symporter